MVGEQLELPFESNLEPSNKVVPFSRDELARRLINLLAFSRTPRNRYRKNSRLIHASEIGVRPEDEEQKAA